MPTPPPPEPTTVQQTVQQDGEAIGQMVKRLGMQPHPEGGYFKETFRDTATVSSASTRAASTAILYLLPAGAKSRLHRLDASECWHAYLGGPITIVELDVATQGVKTTVLGHDLAGGQRLQHVVAPGTWFGAAPCDGTDWALVGCTVAPGVWGGGCAGLQGLAADAVEPTCRPLT